MRTKKGTDSIAKVVNDVKTEAPKVAAKVTKAAAKTAKAADKTVKAAAKKAEEVTEEAKDVVVKAAKAPAKKPLKESVYLQYMGKEIDKDEIVKRVKEVWTKEMKKKIGDIHTLTLYIKPEENMAYYVINGEVTGSVEL
ncbi:MAG: DUF6465 family protein [Lachnospiraceae bacterium]|nr:DUF6465 family protein [Lachnospiraceae bacterium]